MKNKHPNAIVVLALGFAMAGAAPGRPAALVRRRNRLCHGGLGLAAVHPLAGGAGAAPTCPPPRGKPKPTGLQDTCPPLGLLVLAGAALVTSGVAMGPVAKYAVQYPEMFSTDYPTWAAWADLLLPVLCGAWLLYYGGRAFKGFGMQRQSWAVRCLFKPRCRSIFVEIDLAVPVHARVGLPYALRTAGAQRGSSAAVCRGVDQSVPFCRAALRPHAVRGGHRGISALHRAGTDPDPV